MLEDLVPVFEVFNVCVELTVQADNSGCNVQSKGEDLTVGW